MVLRLNTKLKRCWYLNTPTTCDYDKLPPIILERLALLKLCENNDHVAGIGTRLEQHSFMIVEEDKK